MRTTIDLPEDLVTKLKLKAVQEGVSFKTIYNRALARAFGDGTTPPTSPPPKRALRKKNTTR